MPTWYPYVSDALMLFVVFVAPFFAVWAQRRIQKSEEVRSRKKNLFETLMATRQDRLSLEHVKALNMIDIVFSSKNSKEKTVVDAWRIYHDALVHVPPGYYEDQTVQSRHHSKRDDLFIDLLYQMGIFLQYDFSKVDIKNHAYSPNAYIDDEELDRSAKLAVIRLAGNDGVLQTHTTLLPTDAEKS